MLLTDMHDEIRGLRRQGALTSGQAETLHHKVGDAFGNAGYTGAEELLLDVQELIDAGFLDENLSRQLISYAQEFVDLRKKVAENDLDDTPGDEATRKARNAAKELIRRGRIAFDDGDDFILESTADRLPQSQSQRAEELVTAAFEGFFDAATEGFEFVPASRISEKFGRPLEQNYPEAGPAFLKFARTFWTLKIVLQESFEHGKKRTAAYEILAHIEGTVASVFFPTPGPMRVDPEQREQMQRELLRTYAPNIDVQHFISDNPILLRDRAQGAGGGCAGAIALAVGLSGIGVAIAFVLVGSLMQ